MNTQEAHALVVEHMAWARQQARRFKAEYSLNMEREDCEQEALCALVEASGKADEARDFQAFALKFIRDQFTAIKRKEARYPRTVSYGLLEDLAYAELTCD